MCTDYFIMLDNAVFFRIVNEYETFKEKALKVPEDSREMMELIDYMAEAQVKLVVELKNNVEVS